MDASDSNRLEAVTQFRRLKYSIRRYRPLAGGSIDRSLYLAIGCNAARPYGYHAGTIFRFQRLSVPVSIAARSATRSVQLPRIALPASADSGVAES